MSGVEFDEEKSYNEFKSHKVFGESVEPSMARFLKKTGLIKTTTQAKWVMFGIVVVCFSLAIFILIKTALPPQKLHNAQSPQVFQTK